MCPVKIEFSITNCGYQVVPVYDKVIQHDTRKKSMMFDSADTQIYHQRSVICAQSTAPCWPDFSIYCRSSRAQVHSQHFSQALRAELKGTSRGCSWFLIPLHWYSMNSVMIWDIRNIYGCLTFSASWYILNPTDTYSKFCIALHRITRHVCTIVYIQRDIAW